jgi:hypothetical protein
MNFEEQNGKWTVADFGDILMKESYLTVEVSLLWQHMITVMQLESEIKFGEDHNICWILIVSLHSL